MKLRNYIPRTFDAMMVDFGQRLERKLLWQEMEKQHKVMTDDAVPDPIYLKPQVKQYTK